MYKNCLNEETLTNYLDDSLQVTARAVAEEHLISCDACRSRLVYYMRILDEDIHEEEEPVVAAAMERWDPGRIPASSRPSASWAAASPLRKAGLAASVLVAVTLGAVFGLWNQGTVSGAEYLESRLLEDRPFQARTSLQESADDWVEYSQTRDATGRLQSNSPVSEVLLDEAAVGSTADHLRGLGYLIDEDWDDAVTYLLAAVNGSDANPAFLNDLGVAYLEKEKTSSDETGSDYGRAKDCFQQAIDLDADFAPPLFNLVQLYERWDMDAEAAAQGRLYLQMDSDSGWADEVRDMLGEN